VPRAHANGIEIEYETFGDPSKPAILLIMGLGIQMLGWHEVFCNMLAERGYFVIRFDNRDVGLSTHLTGVPAPDPVKLMRGDTSDAAYRLEDMADDAVGLLAALDIERAHIVGVSMGGMIAQTVAIRHPQRTLSLTSIMATPAPYIGPPTPRAQAVLLMPPPADREEAGRRALKVFRVIGSPDYPLDEEAVADVGRRSSDRGSDPAGVLRQLAAIGASGDRTAALRKLAVPALVIHGAADPLVTVEGGQATAAAVTGSRLIVIPGMGHDLPRAVWPVIIDAIAALAKNA
jgi:pimeloyl-ACP methyl ester carboxylesterase